MNRTRSASDARAARREAKLPPTIQLNAAGWAALFGPSALLGAGIGWLAGRRGTSAGMGAAVGALTGLAAARAADEVRRRNAMVSLTVDEADQALDLMQSVRKAGVQVEMVKAPSAPPVEPMPSGWARAHGFALRYRHKDHRRVREALGRGNPRPDPSEPRGHVTPTR